MTSLQTVPCHIADMVLGIALMEEKIVFSSPRDRQEMRMKDFLQLAFACKCALNNNQAGTAKYAS